MANQERGLATVKWVLLLGCLALGLTGCGTLPTAAGSFRADATLHLVGDNGTGFASTHGDIAMVIANNSGNIISRTRIVR